MKRIMQKLIMYYEIHKFKRNGHKLAQIGRLLVMDYRTVKKYLDMNEEEYRQTVSWFRLCYQHRFKEAHSRKDERAGHCPPDAQKHSRSRSISGALYPWLGELLWEVQVVSIESSLSTAKA